MLSKINPADDPEFTGVTASRAAERDWSRSTSQPSEPALIAGPRQDDAFRPFAPTRSASTRIVRRLLMHARQQEDGGPDRPSAAGSTGRAVNWHAAMMTGVCCALPIRGQARAGLASRPPAGAEPLQIPW